MKCEVPWPTDDMCKLLFYNDLFWKDRYFHYFDFLSPWKSVAFHVNNLGFTLPNCDDTLCPVWLTNTVTVEKKFSNCQRSILIVVAAVIGLKYCRYGLKHHPINQLIGLSFEQSWIPITPKCIVPILVETGPVGLE